MVKSPPPPAPDRGLTGGTVLYTFCSGFVYYGHPGPDLNSECMMTRFTLVPLLLGLATPVAAQGPLFVEARAGVVVPTFDIADVATSGTAFGGTLGYRLNPRMVLMGEFDYGSHEDEPTGTVDITTLHYMAKVGWSLTGPRERGWEVALNLGAGAVTFDVDGGDSFTYPAINAGAKITYGFTPSLALVLSPQGDIAFGDEDEIGTSNAWVWPFTAGLRFRF